MLFNPPLTGRFIYSKTGQLWPQVLTALAQPGAMRKVLQTWLFPLPSVKCRDLLGHTGTLPSSKKLETLSQLTGLDLYVHSL